MFKKLLEDFDSIALATLREVRHQIEQDEAVIDFRFLCANPITARGTDRDIGASGR